MRYKAAILDMDGVIWKADQQIGNLCEVFRLLRDRFAEFVFCTNNSTQPPRYVQQKMSALGVDFPEERILTSSNAVADQLTHQYSPGDRILVIGETGLKEALLNKGFILSTNRPAAVVVGMDKRFTYQRICDAVIAIRNGAAFYGTNPDLTFPSPEGLIPGAGSIIELIRVSCGVEPIIAGKPQPYMLDLAMKLMHTSPAETLVIGDRLDTDILGGQAANCPTALVLSGVTDLEAVSTSHIHPDLVAQDLTSLISSL